MPTNYECEGQMSIFDLISGVGRMSPEPCPQIPAEISNLFYEKYAGSLTRPPMYLSLRKENGPTGGSWMAIHGKLHGVVQTQALWAFHNEENESFLSQILEEGVRQKYFLSRAASLGILRRSVMRGKILPSVLKTALISQAGLSQEEYEQAKQEWQEKTTAEKTLPAMEQDGVVYV